MRLFAFRSLGCLLLSSLFFTSLSCHSKRNREDKGLQSAGYSRDVSGFMKAINKGDLPAVELFLKKGFSPYKMVGKEGLTPLHMAVLAQQEKIAKLLLDKGVAVDILDQKGQTPLMLASQVGSEKMIDFLLEEGALVHAKDKEGLTPLFHAIRAEKLNAIGILSPLNTEDLNTAMLYASLTGKTHTLETLASFGGSVYARHDGGQTPLMFASLKGHQDTVNKLLSLGANPYAIDNEGRTASQIAAEAGYIEIANKLGTPPSTEQIALIGDEELEVASQESGQSQHVEHIEGKQLVVPPLDDRKEEKEPVELSYSPVKPLGQSDGLETPLKSLVMRQYHQKPLPLLVEKTKVNERGDVLANVRMLYGKQQIHALPEGEIIPHTPFRIVRISRQFAQSKFSQGNYEDISTVEIEDLRTHKRRVLHARIPGKAQEPWALLENAFDKKQYSVRTGQRFSTSDGKTYEVSDVRPSQIVLTNMESSESYTLPLQVR